MYIDQFLGVFLDKIAAQYPHIFSQYNVLAIVLTNDLMYFVLMVFPCFPFVIDKMVGNPVPVRIYPKSIMIGYNTLDFCMQFPIYTPVNDIIQAMWLFAGHENNIPFLVRRE